MQTVAPVNYIEIRDGIPVIAPRGHKVAFIAAEYVHGGMSIEWIAENYDLTPAQIHAALSYYYDHTEELDRYAQENDAQIEQEGVPLDEILEQMRQRMNEKRGDNHTESS
jgi:uncharacterized protein (DUF433 family)